MSSEWTEWVQNRRVSSEWTKWAIEEKISLLKNDIFDSVLNRTYFIMTYSKTYWIYIICNKPYGTLYIGVTNNLKRRITEHKLGEGGYFSSRYKLKRLVYFETFSSIRQAIDREKQLKRWHRQWKINLLEMLNPEWYDLYDSL